MANICLYKIKVKGSKIACEKFIDMMPLYSWEKEILSEKGDEKDYEIIFLGACKNHINAYTIALKDVVPYTQEELEKIEDGDGWNYTLKDKSILLDCDVYCNFKDIDSAGYSIYVHFNKGREIMDECPKELHIKRGRDYDQEYSFDENENLIVKEENCIPKTICKVKFEDGRSYLYLGEYKIGDMVYVEGAKANCLGKVIETTIATNNPDYYNIISYIGSVEEYRTQEIENIWNSFLKAKDRKIYLESIGFDKDITKKKFLLIMENKWNRFSLEKRTWKEFFDKEFSYIINT